MKHRINLTLPNHIRNAVCDESFKVVYNRTDDGVEIFLTGVVGDEYTQSDSASIAKVLSQAKGQRVTLRVNSGGGLAFDGLAIFNAMAGHDGETVGIVEGIAASAASLAVIGCDTVKMHENATYHIHEGLSFAFGHIAELQDAIEWLEQFNQAAVATYSAKSGRPAKEIAAELLGPKGDGTKYTASEAKKAGFIDEIIPLTKAKPRSEDGQKLQAMLDYRIAQAKRNRFSPRQSVQPLAISDGFAEREASRLCMTTSELKQHVAKLRSSGVDNAIASN